MSELMTDERWSFVMDKRGEPLSKRLAHTGGVTVMLYNSTHYLIKRVAPQLSDLQLLPIWIFGTSVEHRRFSPLLRFIDIVTLPCHHQLSVRKVILGIVKAFPEAFPEALCVHVTVCPL